MLRLLPKDVVNYIYEFIHKSNTQDIVNEYKGSLRAGVLGESSWYYIYINRTWIDFNYRHTSSGYIYNKHGCYCANLPKRYKYSLTQEELQSMLVSTPTK